MRCTVRQSSARPECTSDRVLAHYVEGWAEADVDKIFDATAPNYRFTDPLVGSFSGRSLHEYFDTLQMRSPAQERSQSTTFPSFSAAPWSGPPTAGTFGSGVRRR